MPSLSFLSPTKKLKQELAAQRFIEEQREEEHRLLELQRQKEHHELLQREDESRRLQAVREEEFRLSKQRYEAEIARRERDDYLRRESERQLQREQQAEEEKQKLLLQEHKVRENKRQERIRKTTPEALRQLRGLIRTRYQLDCLIWSCRDGQRADRGLVIQHGQRADAILQEIFDIVNTWDESSFQGNSEEWKVAKKIKEQLTSSEKAIWQDTPPWDYREVPQRRG